jgi:hypothetical protein
MSIVSTTKELIDLAKKGATIELELKLVQMQERELELREEIVKLKTEITNLKSTSNNDDNLNLIDGVYFKDSKAYCQVCWDSEKKLINLQSSEEAGFDEYERHINNFTVYKCLKCQAVYSHEHF